MLIGTLHIAKGSFNNTLLEGFIVLSATDKTGRQSLPKVFQTTFHK